MESVTQLDLDGLKARHCLAHDWSIQAWNIEVRQILVMAVKCLVANLPVTLAVQQVNDFHSPQWYPRPPRNLTGKSII